MHGARPSKTRREEVRDGLLSGAVDGLEVGCRADFVLPQAPDPIETIRIKATRLAVVRQGEAESAGRSGRAVDEVGSPAAPEGVPFVGARD